MRIVLSVLVLGLLTAAGCGSAQKTNRLSIGMTKDEVIKTMGRPTSTASPGAGKEILVYSLHQTDKDWWYGYTSDYFVRLIDGKVESYGEKGDFGSTQNPAIDLNVTTEKK